MTDDTVISVKYGGDGNISGRFCRYMDMADVMTPEQRHRCMAAIRGKDTKPEMIVRKYLFSRGLRFRVQVRKLPGNPDIVLPKYRTAVFVNGCFWHGHEGCRYFRLPKSNIQFWQEKISRNIARDCRNTAALQALGWRVITLWECDIRTAATRRISLEDLYARITDTPSPAQHTAYGQPASDGASLAAEPSPGYSAVTHCPG